jgi:hypothetical protein
MQASGIASSSFTSNKPKVAPGLQDLGDSVASYVLVAGYIVPHWIYVEPAGSGAGGDLGSALSRSTIGEPAYGGDPPRSTPLPALLSTSFQVEGRPLPLVC